jgi:general stress protein 26
MSIEEVRNIIREAGYGSVATCVDGQPRVRPMAFVMTDEGKLWSSTHETSGKVKEFEANPAVEVSFTDARKYHVRVEGTVDLSGGLDKKAALFELNPRVKRHFGAADDPRYMHVEVTPTRIRWTEPGFGEYHEVQLV